MTSSDESLLAVRTNADEADTGSSQFFEAFEVGFGQRREVGELPDATEILLPALVGFVNRDAGGQIGGGARRVVDGLAAQGVGGANLDGVQATSTESSQPQRRARPVVAPNSRPMLCSMSPMASFSVTKGPLPTRVV